MVLWDVEIASEGFDENRPWKPGGLSLWEFCRACHLQSDQALELQSPGTKDAWMTNAEKTHMKTC